MSDIWTICCLTGTTNRPEGPKPAFILARCLWQSKNQATAPLPLT